MRKWFLIMATAVVLCSACGKKDASVNDATQAAQASSTEAENLYKEGSQYVGEEDYESAIEFPTPVSGKEHTHHSVWYLYNLRIR